MVQRKGDDTASCPGHSGFHCHPLASLVSVHPLAHWFSLLIHVLHVSGYASIAWHWQPQHRDTTQLLRLAQNPQPRSEETHRGWSCSWLGSSPAHWSMVHLSGDNLPAASPGCCTRHTTTNQHTVLHTIETHYKTLRRLHTIASIREWSLARTMGQVWKKM